VLSLPSPPLSDSRSVRRQPASGTVADSRWQYFSVAAQRLPGAHPHMIQQQAGCKGSPLNHLFHVESVHCFLQTLAVVAHQLTPRQH